VVIEVFGIIWSLGHKVEGRQLEESFKKPIVVEHDLVIVDIVTLIVRRVELENTVSEYSEKAIVIVVGTVSAEKKDVLD